MKTFATHYNTLGEYQSTPRQVQASSKKDAATKLGVSIVRIYLKNA